MMQQLQTGEFTFRSLQQQFQSVLKLGNINSFMSMIPGIGNSILSQTNEKETTERI